MYTDTPGGLALRRPPATKRPTRAAIEQGKVRYQQVLDEGNGKAGKPKARAGPADIFSKIVPVTPGSKKIASAAASVGIMFPTNPLVAGVKTAIAVALFGLLTALAPYLRTNMPVYADSAQIQLSMKYHNPHVCVNGKRVLPKVDEGFSPLDLLGRRALKADKEEEEEEAAAEREKEGEGASTSYLTLYDIKGKPDIKAALEHFVHDYYSVQLFVRDEPQLELYLIKSKIMMWIPPFLLRAVTAGVMSSSLGKIMIDVDEADFCTEDAILGQPEEIQRMLGAAVSHDLLVALDRVGDFVAFRALANTTNATAAGAADEAASPYESVYGESEAEVEERRRLGTFVAMTYEHEAEAINYTKEEYVGPARSFHWQVLTCLESRKPSQLAVAQYPLEYNNTFRVAQHEYLFCTDTALGMTKEISAFGTLNVVLCVFFVFFVYVATSNTLIMVADDIADKEVDELRATDYKDHPMKGMAQEWLLAKFDETNASAASKKGGQASLRTDEEGNLIPDPVNPLLERPLFLIDFVLSDPVETAFDLKQGAISACVHVGFVALGGAPIVLLGLLLSCSHEDEFVDQGVCTHREWVDDIYKFFHLKDAVCLAWLVSHYWGTVPGMSVVTSVVRRPAKLPTILAPSLILILMAVVMTRQVRPPRPSCSSYLPTSPNTSPHLPAGPPPRQAAPHRDVGGVGDVLLQHHRLARPPLLARPHAGESEPLIRHPPSLLRLVLSCILKPARAIAFLCLLAGPGMYVVLGAAGLFKAQQMIVGSQEKKKAAQKLKELNLRTQDIIAIVISGLVLLVMFAAFILLGFLLFTSSLDSPASIGPALGMLGGGVQQAQKTSAKAQSQVGGAVEKIDTATVDQSELPSADVEAPEPDPVTLDAAPEEAAE